MAGVDAMTLPGEVLEELASTTDSQESLEARSVFHSAAQTPSAHSARLSYIDDKAKFHRAYTTNGRGKAKTEDVSEPFRAFLLQLTFQAVDCGLLRVSSSGRGVSTTSELRPKHRKVIASDCHQRLPLSHSYRMSRLRLVLCLDSEQLNLPTMSLCQASSFLLNEN